MTAAPTPQTPPAGIRPRWRVAAVATSAGVVLMASLVLAASRDDGRARAPTAARLASTTTTTSVVTSSTAAPVPAAGGLAAGLGELWRRTPGGCLGVAVGGATVFAEQADEPVAPASTLKLATAAAVLERIGPAERLTTTVVTAAALSNGGIVAGDIWLVGGGDPVLATDAWAAARSQPPALHTPLDALADALVAGGVRVVEGRLLGDESRYDAVRQVPTWSQHVKDSNEVGPLSALTVNDGFRAWSGEHGDPFPDAATGAAATFLDLLAARGVEVRGGAGAGAAPAGAVVLARLQSAPVRDLVQAMLRDSDNGTAELLIKELGLRVLREGSTAAGARAALDVLRAKGLPTTGVRIVDGSGLDATNRATCAFFLALLAAIPADGVVADGLPVAARTGTLERRFVDTPVAGRLRAKTGSLDGVAALVGYAAPLAGPTIAFAYLVEGIDTDAAGRRLYEELAANLVSGGG